MKKLFLKSCILLKDKTLKVLFMLCASVSSPVKSDEVHLDHL